MVAAATTIEKQASIIVIESQASPTIGKVNWERQKPGYRCVITRRFMIEISGVTIRLGRHPNVLLIRTFGAVILDEFVEARTVHSLASHI